MLNPCACSTNTILSMYIASNTSSICFFAKFTDNNRAVFLERNVQAKKRKRKKKFFFSLYFKKINGTLIDSRTKMQ